MMLPARNLMVLLALCGSVASWAQAVDSADTDQRKTLPIYRTDTAPLIDGVLSDAVWNLAAVIDEDDLHQYVPIDHGTPSERTYC